VRLRADDPPLGRSGACRRAAAASAWAAGLGFGPLGAYGTAYFAEHHEVWHFMGFPTYGGGPFETIGITPSVPLLTGFVAICAAEVVAGWMLWADRPYAPRLSFALLPLEMTYWIGFALPVGPVLGLIRAAAVAASVRASSQP
jgi:hypothetical protein